MKKTVRIIILAFIALYSILFVIGSIIAPILAHFKLYQSAAMLTSVYSFACHQGQKGSFWILGYPVALCARCLGFYTGTFFFALKSIFNKIQINIKTLGILILISILGLLCNPFLKNALGNILRFIIGVILGLLLIVLINMAFNLLWRRKKNEN